MEKLKTSERKSQQLLRKSLITLRGQLAQVKQQHSTMHKQSVNALEETKDLLIDSLSSRKQYIRF